MLNRAVNFFVIVQATDHGNFPYASSPTHLPLRIFMIRGIIAVIVIILGILFFAFYPIRVNFGAVGFLLFILAGLMIFLAVPIAFGWPSLRSGQG